MYVCNVDEASAVNGNKYVDMVREAVKDENAEILVVAAKNRSRHRRTGNIRRPSDVPCRSRAGRIGRRTSYQVSLQAAEPRNLLHSRCTGKYVHGLTRKDGKLRNAQASSIPISRKDLSAREVIKYDDYIQYGSEAAVKEAGKLGVEGKEYVVQDGDIMHFRFNV